MALEIRPSTARCSLDTTRPLLRCTPGDERVAGAARAPSCPAPSGPPSSRATTPPSRGPGTLSALTSTRSSFISSSAENDGDSSTTGSVNAPDASSRACGLPPRLCPTTTSALISLPAVRRTRRSLPRSGRLERATRRSPAASRRRPSDSRRAWAGRRGRRRSRRCRARRRAEGSWCPRRVAPTRPAPNRRTGRHPRVGAYGSARAGSRGGRPLTREVAGSGDATHVDERLGPPAHARDRRRRRRVQRVEEPGSGDEAVKLMVTAAQAAADDSGSRAACCGRSSASRCRTARGTTATPAASSPTASASRGPHGARADGHAAADAARRRVRRDPRR